MTNTILRRAVLGWFALGIMFRASGVEVPDDPRANEPGED